MKNKFKKFFGFFKLSNLKAQIEELGGNITSKTIILLALAIVFGAFIVCFLLKLQIYYCAFLIIFFLMCLPFMIILTFRASYEKIRFNDTVEYMEQLIYSFHKSGKIRESLVDVFNVSRGNVKNVVSRMVHNLDYNSKSTRLFEDTFQIIEDEYKCSRMKILHSYLISCEKDGGDSTASLNMMLDDIRSWSERTLEYQNDRKKARNNVILSIFLAMLTCGAMINLIPAEYVDQMVVQLIYQLVTTFVITLCIIVYIIVQMKVSKSYLDIEMDGESEGAAMRQMKYLSAWHRKNHFKNVLIVSGIMSVFVGVEIYLGLGYLVIPTILLLMWVAFWDFLKRNSATKQVIKELNKMFPVWVRNLVLYLQTNNTHVAIQKSLGNCPKILKPELRLFLQDLANDPITMAPYKKFLKGFNVPTLRMSINYLYSISQFGTEDMLAQLDYLIKQNTQLTINEEKLRNENALAGINLYVYMPMIIAVIKLMLDMLLFLTLFIGLMGSYV